MAAWTLEDCRWSTLGEQGVQEEVLRSDYKRKRIGGFCDPFDRGYDQEQYECREQDARGTRLNAVAIPVKYRHRVRDDGGDDEQCEYD